jgi:hypothetical protein
VVRIERFHCRCTPERHRPRGFSVKKSHTSRNVAGLGNSENAPNALSSQDLRLHQGSNPNSATPVCVPTNTFPFTITVVMNLFPLPKLSRPAAA